MQQFDPTEKQKQCHTNQQNGITMSLKYGRSHKLLSYGIGNNYFQH
jgi:hypothetical protein